MAQDEDFPTLVWFSQADALGHLAQLDPGADMGLHVAGGKGGTSRKTPSEIVQVSDKFSISTGDFPQLWSLFCPQIDEIKRKYLAIERREARLPGGHVSLTAVPDCRVN